MAIEIERRFLVEGEQWKNHAKAPQVLRQAYLASKANEWTVRIRLLENKKAWLTLKSPSEGISNNEFEYLIPINDAESIWKIVPHKIIKTRYELNLPGGEWIIDCFKGKNSPLVLAEVELPSTEMEIEKPSWCALEVTGEYRWSNAGLAKNPISNWSEGILSSHKISQKGQSVL